MGVAPNHSFLAGIFQDKTSIWEYPHLWKPLVGYGRKMGVTATYIYIYIIHMGFSGIEVSGL